MPILQVSDLKKIYTTRFGGQKVQALTNVNFAVEPGEYVAIMGESGSGKTTLLNILAALDKPTSGKVLLDGRDIVAIREREIAAFRRDNLGFVFQDFNLLDTFSVRDNILLPLVLAGKTYPDMAKRLAPLARRLGLEELLGKFPYEISGGQKQRVAVARALTMEPALLIADEPTSMLDPSGKANLLRMLKGLQNSRGFSMLMITHDLDAALKISDRIFLLEGGKLRRLDPNDHIRVDFDRLFDAG